MKPLDPLGSRFQSSANSLVASRIPWSHCYWQEVSRIGQGTPVQQDNCWQEKDLEEAQHIIIMALQMIGQNVDLLKLLS